MYTVTGIHDRNAELCSAEEYGRLLAYTDFIIVDLCALTESLPVAEYI